MTEPHKPRAARDGTLSGAGGVTLPDRFVSRPSEARRESTTTTSDPDHPNTKRPRSKLRFGVWLATGICLIAVVPLLATLLVTTSRNTPESTAISPAQVDLPTQAVAPYDDGPDIVVRAEPTASDDASSLVGDLASLTGGERLVLAPGTYTLDQTIELPDDVHLMGSGQEKTTLIVEDPITGILIKRRTAVRISNLRIQGPESPGPNDDVPLIQAVDSNVVIDKVTVVGASGTGLEIKRSDTTDRMSTAVVDSSTFEGNRTGVRLSGVQATMTNNIARQNSVHGFVWTRAAGGPAVNNTAEDNGANGFAMLATTPALYSNTATGNEHSGFYWLANVDTVDVTSNVAGLEARNNSSNYQAGIIPALGDNVIPPSGIFVAAETGDLAQALQDAAVTNAVILLGEGEHELSGFHQNVQGLRIIGAGSDKTSIRIPGDSTTFLLSGTNNILAGVTLVGRNIWRGPPRDPPIAVVSATDFLIADVVINTESQVHIWESDGQVVDVEGSAESTGSVLVDESSNVLVVSNISGDG